ncbi:FMN-linked oxidoreductase [Aureobasidium sp. EXF-10727]|nr:FMN-linked oxidoreductase [Aureobasidium sp. EXF-10727]
MPSPNLFRPLKLGRIELRHRIVMAPVTRLFTDEDHVRPPFAVEHYAQRASEGGLVIAEATVVSLELSGGKRTPGIWTCAQISRWKEVTDAVHAKGAHIFLSIDSLEPLADAALSTYTRGRQASASSDTTSLKRSDSPSESHTHVLNEEEIKSTTRAFVQAARNAVTAGFDGVEVGANGYFIYQPLHRHLDEYGGHVESRVRFALEVTIAIADAIGADRVGFRMNPSSAFRMSSLEPEFACLTARLKELRLAYIHIIKSYAITNLECDKHEGIKPFLALWAQTSPVLVAGDFTPESARSALDTEYPNSDVALVFGQQFLAVQEAEQSDDDHLGFKIPELKSLNASFYTGFV